MDIRCKVGSPLKIKLGKNSKDKVFFLKGKNATGKTLALSMVKGIVQYNDMMAKRSRLISISSNDLVEIAKNSNRLETTGERMGKAILNKLKNSKNIKDKVVLLDDFSMFLKSEYGDSIVNEIRSQAKAGAISLALIALASNESKLRIVPV